MKTQYEPCILMVEDELEVLRINARIISRRGYEVLTASNCRQAYEILDEVQPDLLILDIMLPDGDGFEICRRFRNISDNPIIFLTGKNEVSDRIEGLSQGGDYYITKPYDPDELLAAVARLIEKHLKIQKKHEELTVITKGALSIDIPRSRATVDGVDAGLTSKEFALLLVLVQNEDTEVSPRDLYEKVWGVPSVEDVRTVRTHMKNLRKKIGADDAADYDIVSSYGRGYTFTTIR